MPIEQRVIGAPKIGAKNPSGGIGAKKAEVEPEEPKKGSKKKLLIIIVAAVVVLGVGAAYLLGVFGGGKSATATPAPTPTSVPGLVLAVDPISINLADGHYLRLGLGLQLTDKVAKADEPAPAQALDLAIVIFSGHTVAEVSDPATRDALKAQLLAGLATAYEGKVMDVYLMNYVTQ